MVGCDLAAQLADIGREHRPPRDPLSVIPLWPGNAFVAARVMKRDFSSSLRHDHRTAGLLQREVHPAQACSMNPVQAGKAAVRLVKPCFSRGAESCRPPLVVCSTRRFRVGEEKESRPLPAAPPRSADRTAVLALAEVSRSTNSITAVAPARPSGSRPSARGGQPPLLCVPRAQRRGAHASATPPSRRKPITSTSRRAGHRHSERNPLLELGRLPSPCRSWS